MKHHPLRLQFYDEIVTVFLHLPGLAK